MKTKRDNNLKAFEVTLTLSFNDILGTFHEMSETEQLDLLVDMITDFRSNYPNSCNSLLEWANKGEEELGW